MFSENFDLSLFINYLSTFNYDNFFKYFISRTILHVRAAQKNTSKSNLTRYIIYRYIFFSITLYLQITVCLQLATIMGIYSYKQSRELIKTLIRPHLI